MVAMRNTHAHGERPTATKSVLLEIPNVGPAMAGDLQRLGISTLDDLKDRDAREMYETLCRLDGARHDPCVLDVFTAVVE